MSKENRSGKRHLTQASDVLQGLLKNSKSGLADGFMRWRLEREWSAVVGETIAAQTVPCAFERGTLHIWVKHPAWMQQLWFFQDLIKNKVNGHVQLQWVARVRFTLNRRAACGQIGQNGLGEQDGSGGESNSSEPRE